MTVNKNNAQMIIVAVVIRTLSEILQQIFKTTFENSLTTVMTIVKMLFVKQVYAIATES